MVTNNESNPPWPNRLREYRDAAYITRAQLSLKCSRLAEQDETRFVPVSLGAIRHLESGSTRPRRSTAATVSAALNVRAEEMFPNGFDDPVRNPHGHTRTSTKR